MFGIGSLGAENRPGPRADWDSPGEKRSAEGLIRLDATVDFVLLLNLIAAYRRRTNLSQIPWMNTHLKTRRSVLNPVRKRVGRFFRIEAPISGRQRLFKHRVAMTDNEVML